MKHCMMPGIKKIKSMEEQLVTYEVAKLAKEKGFNEKTDKFYPIGDTEGVAIEHCDGPDYFNKYPYTIAAPTQSLLQRWLREGNHIEVIVLGQEYVGGPYYGEAYSKRGLENRNCNPHNTYELALEDGLKFALEKLLDNEERTR